jgi:hypothetical protein
MGTSRFKMGTAMGTFFYQKTYQSCQMTKPLFSIKPREVLISLEYKTQKSPYIAVKALFCSLSWARTKDPLINSPFRLCDIYFLFVSFYLNIN